MIGMGRPASKNPRKVPIRANLTEGEAEQLRIAAEILGASRTEIIAQGIARMNAYALSIKRKKTSDSGGRDN